MALITCRNVTLSYENRPVVTGVDFTVEAGDFLCIAGENGSGKSTLLKSILGLRRVQSGTIELGEKREAMGYLPQQSAAQQDFPASVWEVVLSGCLGRRGGRPFYTKADRERARANMARLEIGDLTNRGYRELSGGQQQRVLLARALCAAEKILLLDEPVTGLDPLVCRDMYALLGQLNKRDGMTVVMVSHDVDETVGYASRILHIGQHRQIFFGSAQDYLNTPEGRLYAGREGGCDHC